MLRRSSTPEEVAELIAKAIIYESYRQKVPFELIAAMAEVESLFNPSAKNKSGASGLLQILIEDGVEIDPKQAFGIFYNVEKGILIFKSKLEKADGNLRKTLSYYSGHAVDYDEKVFSSMGRFLLFRINGEIDENRTVETTRESSG